jgi:hypothetical protein
MFSGVAVRLIPNAALTAAAHSADTGPSPMLTVGLLVIAGLIVALFSTVSRYTWTRRRVPTALSRVVRRESYLGEVLSESKRAQYDGLDVLAPRLTPAVDAPMIADIQAAWKQISERGQISRRGHVRVATLDSLTCLQGGLELLAHGIQVRVARRGLNSEDLSYHVFVTGGSADTVILNRHSGTKNRPLRMPEQDVTKVYRDNFEGIWAASTPIEAVIAEEVIEKARGSREPADVLRALNDVLCTLNVTPARLGPTLDVVLRHLAFRSGSSVIFVIGLPGSGKSLARRLLAQRLERLGIACRVETDYVYAYRDFLHGLIMLEPRRVDGFEPCREGAFAVRDEAALRPALQALEAAVRDGLKDSEVTIAEFARSDLVAALNPCTDIRTRCWILYVEAPAERRADRLGRRVEPPELTVDGTSVTLTPSDNHRLPSAPLESLYATDDIGELEKSWHWRGRIIRIQNPVDDGGTAIAARLDEFIARVIDQYRPPSA